MKDQTCNSRHAFLPLIVCSSEVLLESWIDVIVLAEIFYDTALINNPVAGEIAPITLVIRADGQLTLIGEPMGDGRSMLPLQG